MGCIHLAIRAGGGDTRGDDIDGGGVFGMGGGGGLATSCVSCCSCTVRATRVVLMLFLETFCLSVSLWRWCCRYPKVSAMPWGVSGGNDIWRAEFLRARYDREGNLLGSYPLR